MKIAHVVPDLLTSLEHGDLRASEGSTLTLRRLLRLSGADAGALEFDPPPRRADRGDRRGGPAACPTSSRRSCAARHRHRGAPRRDARAASRAGAAARGPVPAPWSAASPWGRAPAGGPARAGRARAAPRAGSRSPRSSVASWGRRSSRVWRLQQRDAAHDRAQRDHPAARLQRLARRRARRLRRRAGPARRLRLAGGGAARPRAPASSRCSTSWAARRRAWRPATPAWPLDRHAAGPARRRRRADPRGRRQRRRGARGEPAPARRARLPLGAAGPAGVPRRRLRRRHPGRAQRRAAFDDTDVEVAAELARPLASAIEQRRLLDESRRRAEELAALFRRASSSPRAWTSPRCSIASAAR